MGDLFHKNVIWETHFEIFETMIDNPQHTYLFLTKRPKRMKEVFKIFDLDAIKNLWIGVTAENQKRANERIPILLSIPAKVHFVSIEPMLDVIDLTGEGYIPVHMIGGVEKETFLDWVICGPETGPGRRECKPEWIENLYKQCKEANIPFFDKRKTGWLAREFPIRSPQK